MILLKTLLGWLTGGVLGRLLDTVDRTVDSKTKREEIKGSLVQEYLRTQAAMASGRGWWFPLFFIVPLGLWFSSVCLYSVLFCAKCAMPQTWVIAALPPPLDEWAGIIVSSLFIGKVGQALIKSYKN